MSRSIAFVPEAWDSYVYWQGQDKKTLKRINILLSNETKLNVILNFVGNAIANPRYNIMC